MFFLSLKKPEKPTKPINVEKICQCYNLLQNFPSINQGKSSRASFFRISLVVSSYFYEVKILICPIKSLNGWL